MIALVTIPVIAGIYAARWIGVHYGWGYHAALLVVLAGYTVFMFRVTLGRRPKKIDLSVFQSSSADAQALGGRLAALHGDVERLDAKLRIDVYVGPVLLFAPTIIALLLLRQAAYTAEYRLWSAAGIVVVLPYFLIRYALPQKKH